MFVEDILHLLVDSLEVNPADSHILSSISCQVKKGVSLSDRQHQLVKLKIQQHHAQFKFDVNQYVDKLQYPLRVIDRTKSITIVSSVEEDEKKSSNLIRRQNVAWKWMKIKFPFSKKTVAMIIKLSATRFSIEYHHEVGSNVHYFRLTESTVKDVIGYFKNKKFEIDSILLEQYNLIESIIANKDTYLTTITATLQNNIVPAVNKLILAEVGEINTASLIKIADRKRRYNINRVDVEDNGDLISKIALRPDVEISIDPAIYSLKNVAEAFTELDRFPLLVAIDDDNTLQQVSDTVAAFSTIISASQQSVLFRVPAQIKYNINHFVRDNKLNNWVDNHTKIVYINKNKLPKLLITAEWNPIAALTLTGTRTHSHVNLYMNKTCDLIAHHDKAPSLFKKNMRMNGHL